MKISGHEHRATLQNAILGVTTSARRPLPQGYVATSLHRSAGGQFVAHIKSQPGAPYDGHTLAALIPEMEEQLGTTINRIIADRGYRGHNAPSTHQFKVYIAGQKRRVTNAIRRELRRRPAVEPGLVT